MTRSLSHNPVFSARAAQPVVIWIARIGSLISGFMIAMFAFGGGESMTFLSKSEVVGFALFPVGVLLGMLLAWRWPLAGSLVSLAAFGLFYLWHFVASGDVPTGPWFFVFSSPMVLFFVGGFLGRRPHKPQ